MSSLLPLFLSPLVPPPPPPPPQLQQLLFGRNGYMWPYNMLPLWDAISMKGPQVTQGAQTGRVQWSWRKWCLFLFYSSQPLSKKAKPHWSFTYSQNLYSSLSMLLPFLLLCPDGAYKWRWRPLKQDHSRGSSQYPPPTPQNILWLRVSCAGAHGQASAARGPQRCRLRCGQRLPLHSPTPSSHTLLYSASLTHTCLRFGVTPPPPFDRN